MIRRTASTKTARKPLLRQLVGKIAPTRKDTPVIAGAIASAIVEVVRLSVKR